MTPEDYQQMLVKQGGVCAICNQVERVINPRTGLPKPLAIDHNHATGRVRGLLCSRCNLGIGSFGENVQYLLEAVAYLNSDA